MLSRSMVQTFYRYNHWANQRILDTAEHLNAEQFIAKVGASFDSVRDTLVHTMIVQRNWLARFQRQALEASPEFTAYPTLPSIRAEWVSIETATQAFVKTITEESLAETIHYVNSQGKHCHYTLWQMMLHQVNHSTQHRSEVAVMLTQFGYSPGWLDFLIYLDSL